MAIFNIRKRKERKPSMSRKLFFSLGSLAMILLLSSVISILEYRRMSDYVSELIAANIKSINLSQRLADLTQEYNDQMLAVVIQNDISMMPDFNLDYFNDYIEAAGNAALYDTGAEFDFNDRFLTLQTCVQNHDELREIVLCKEVGVIPFKSE